MGLLIQSETKFNLDKKKVFYIFGLLCNIFIVFSITSAHFSADAFFMIRHGEDIIKNGFSTSNEFLSVHSDIGFMHQKWLMCIIAYAVYQLDGLRGIYITSLFMSAVSASLMFAVMNKLNPNDKYCNLLPCLTINFFINAFSAYRPQTIACALIILEIFVLEKYVKNELSSTKLYLILSGISIITMWCHSTMWMFCLIPLLPYIFDLKIINDFVSKIRFGVFRKVSYEAYDKKPLMIGLIIMILCGFLQPNGVHQFPFLYNIMTSSVDDGYAASEMQSIYRTIMESPFSLSVDDLVFAIVGPGSIIIYVFCLLLTNKSSVRLRHIYFVIGCLLLHVWAIRLNVYALTMLGVVSAAIKSTDQTEKKPGSVSEQLSPIVALVLLAMFVINAPLGFRRLLSEQSEREYNIAFANLYGIDAIYNNVSDFANVRIFTGGNIGSYVHLLGGKSYTDGRQEVYDDRVNHTRNILREQLGYYEIIYGSDDKNVIIDTINTIQDKYDFDYYLIKQVDNQALYDAISEIGYYNYADKGIIVFSLKDQREFVYDNHFWVDDTILAKL